MKEKWVTRKKSEVAKDITKMGLTIVDYSHDEVAMSPEPPEVPFHHYLTYVLLYIFPYSYVSLFICSCITSIKLENRPILSLQ